MIGKSAVCISRQRRGNVVNNSHKLIGKWGNAGTKEQKECTRRERKKNQGIGKHYQPAVKIKAVEISMGRLQLLADIVLLLECLLVQPVVLSCPSQRGQGIYGPV